MILFKYTNSNLIKNVVFFICLPLFSCVTNLETEEDYINEAKTLLYIRDTDYYDQAYRDELDYLTKNYFIENSKNKKIVNFYYVCELGDTVATKVVFPLNKNTYNRKDVTVYFDYRNLWLLNQSEKLNRFKNYLQYMMFSDEKKENIFEIYRKRKLYRLLSEMNLMQKFLNGITEKDIIIQENELEPINKTNIQVCLNNSLFWYDYMGHDRWLINFYKPISVGYSKSSGRMFNDYYSTIEINIDSTLQIVLLTTGEFSYLQDSIILANKNK